MQEDSIWNVLQKCENEWLLGNRIKAHCSSIIIIHSQFTIHNSQFTIHNFYVNPFLDLINGEITMAHVVILGAGIGECPQPMK